MLAFYENANWRWAMTMRTGRMIAVAVALTGVPVVGAGGQEAAEDVAIVLDVSNSMWGQRGGGQSGPGLLP